MPVPQGSGVINRKSARQAVYEEVCDWIITGVLEPGEKILDSELGEYFHVSRTPVREALQQLAKLPSVTKDGHAIRLYANLAGTDDLPLLQQSGAEGVGLLRSEFLYLGRSSYPTEDELFASYRQLVQAMDGREIIIRTLDIGADKKADYFDLPPEDNPALGLRAIRLCLTRPALLQTQLCAILRASAFGNVGVMFPMVTGPAELAQLKAALRDAEDTLCARGERFGRYQTGVMIETPAAVFMSRELAREVDFFSIGTNDLIGYTMCADRGNDTISNLYQVYYPAVLRSLKNIIESGVKAGIMVGMCGEAAADPLLEPLLISWGLEEFSMSAPSILRARKTISQWTKAECDELAEKALACNTAAEVKALLESAAR